MNWILHCFFPRTFLNWCFLVHSLAQYIFWGQCRSGHFVYQLCWNWTASYKRRDFVFWSNCYVSVTIKCILRNHILLNATRWVVAVSLRLKILLRYWIQLTETSLSQNCWAVRTQAKTVNRLSVNWNLIRILIWDHLFLIESEDLVRCILSSLSQNICCLVGSILVWPSCILASSVVGVGCQKHLSSFHKFCLFIKQ